MKTIPQITTKYTNIVQKKEYLVLHRTLGNYPSDLKWLVNNKPNTTKDDEISAQFYIPPQGGIYEMVDQRGNSLRNKSLWHSGKIFNPSERARKVLKKKWWDGQWENPNYRSTGVELSARTKNTIFKEVQMRDLVILARELDIPIITHFDIDSRKPLMEDWLDELLKRLSEKQLNNWILNAIDNGFTEQQAIFLHNELKDI